MTLLLVHAAATLYLAGLIWVVQWVHYPLMDRVAEAAFAGFHAEHSRRITAVVGVPMLVEATTAVLLVVRRPGAVPAAWIWTGLALVVVVWLSTALLQVPAHGKLAEGFDAEVHRGLVRGNWIRTAAWSARALLALAMLRRAAG